MTEQSTEAILDDPSGFSGPTEHHPTDVHEDGARSVLRTITSRVWGGIAATVNSEHGHDVRTWNPTCSWYQYGKDYGLNGCQHPGMDIGVPWGTSLYAAADGRVLFAGANQFYTPYHIRIETDDRHIHIYGHMSSIDQGVRGGGRVRAGQYLGKSGTNNGPHLHFELRVPSGRCSSGYCVETPEPLLTNGSTQGQSTSTGFAAGDRIEVDVEELNFRERPSTGAAKIETLRRGAELCVTGAAKSAGGYMWYPARTAGGKIGWLAGEFCKLVEVSACGFEPGDRVKVSVASLRLREQPTTSAPIVRSLESGTELCVSGASTEAGGYTWYPVKLTGADGGSGWVAGEYCDLVEANGCDSGEVVIEPGAGSTVTAEAIDKRIELSNRVNGRQSKLTGRGETFLALGRKYGVRPEIACAIIQRECQMGADGSHLPEAFNNFGGLTAGRNNARPGTCGAEFYKDRTWMVFCTPEEGLEGVFQVLASEIYRNTGGRFEDIMNLYSPPFENNWEQMWKIFTTVGEQLGASIDRDTPVYIA